MKKLYAFSALLLIHLSFAQTISIPDTSFKNKLLLASSDNGIAEDLAGNPVAIDTNGDGEIQINEATVIGRLNVNGASIYSLEGILGFTSLTNLDCYNNHLSELDLGGLTALTNVMCTRNPLTSLNLTGCDNLAQLSCDRTQLTSLNLANHVNLVDLSCQLNNQLATIDVSGCTSLTFLYCGYNSPGDPGANGPLTSLNVSGCTSLVTLNCAQNKLTDLDLTGLSSLQELDCSYNLLSNFSVHGCTALQNLNCSYNNLQILDIADNTGLIQLDCTTNQLSSLSLTSLESLESLVCSDNKLTTLDLNDLPALTTLYCDQNKLTALDLDGCTNVTDLDCTANQLTELNVSMLTALADLDCSDNEMLASIYMKNTSDEQSFVISGLPNLDLVCCDDTQLSEIQQIVSDYGYSTCNVTSTCELGTRAFADNQARIYPNPAGEILSIQMADASAVSKASIYNVTGQMVLQMQNLRTNTVNIASLSPGVYFIKCESRSATSIFKFIKS